MATIKLDVCFGGFIFALMIDWHVAWILEEIYKLIYLKTKCPIQILYILTKVCTLINPISSNSNPASQQEAKASCHFYFTRGLSIFYQLLATLERWLGSKSSPVKKNCLKGPNFVGFFEEKLWTPLRMGRGLGGCR